MGGFNVSWLKKFQTENRYVVFFFLYVGFCISYIDRSAIGLALPSVSKDFNLAPTEMGVVISVFFIGYSIMQIPGGWFSDKFGSKTVICVALALWSVFTFTTGHAQTLSGLLFLRFVFGLCEGPYAGSCFRAVAEYFPREVRAKYTGFVLSSNYIGSALAPVVVVPLILWFGWRGMFQILGLIGLAYVFLYVFLVKARRPAEEKKDDKKKDLVFDLANRRDRIMRLTINSSRMGDAVLTPKGDKLYYCAAFEGGFDLWERNFRENSTKLIIKGIGGGSMIQDKKGENLYLCTGGQMKIIQTAGNKVSNISFRAEFDLRPAKERDYIFNHVWRQVKDKFYDPNIHGVDWDGYKSVYARYLPYINNNYDFQEMLSEMLGELNGSHTGARYGGTGAAQQTACLGAFYDNKYEGDGLKIVEVIAGGPLTKADSKIKAGCIVEKINNKEIKAGEDYYPLLAGEAGKKVLLAVYDPATGKRFEQQVKAISYGAQRNLLYKRWVENCRKKVDELSGGKVGYVHVKGMDSESFREVYSEVLGRCRNKEAVIVDTRHNGGGWLHDDLATLLSGKEYQQFAPRGQYIGSDPYNKWCKPSCVLVCEDNYSNAHGFPWVYKTLGIGKLVGAPVPGTMTAVWWETQIDPSLVFGIPQVGVRDMQGHYLENQELEPDVEVYNTPEQQLGGEDRQLEEAVRLMLGTIKK